MAFTFFVFVFRFFIFTEQAYIYMCPEMESGNNVVILPPS